MAASFYKRAWADIGFFGHAGMSVAGLDELHGALGDAFASDGPRLVQVDVAPGMALACRRTRRCASRG